MGRRQVSSELTQDRIVAAARGLLSGSNFGEFTIDAVAEHAGVARMTVYYQFGSKFGLLEALFNSLASHRLSPQLLEAMQHSDPVAGLETFISSIAGFWDTDRVIITRLQGLSALDPDFGKVWRQREGLRRQGLTVLVNRVAEKLGRPTSNRLGVVADVLYALVSFETFSAMANGRRAFKDVVPLVTGLALAAFDLPTQRGDA
jgi:AcrR family transcriptional regulator